MQTRPDVLVLGGGGVLAETWMMGVLAGLEDGAGVDMREAESFVGTSAGAVVAVHLAIGRSPRRPSSLSTELELGADRPGHGLADTAAVVIRRAGRTALAPSSAVAPVALGVSAPGGALVRSLLLRALPTPSHTLDDLHARIDAAGADFDGRLRIVAVDRGSGRRVVFGSPRAPAATVADAVVASCSVPWLFAPVAIAGRRYVDGGVWSPTNLDAAPAGRDTHVLCLNPTASLGGDQPLLAVVRNVARAAATAEALAMRGRGARVRMLAPNAECAAAIGADFIDSEPRIRVLDAAYRQGLRAAA